MASAAALKPRTVERSDVYLVRVDPPWPALCRFLYTEVGAAWHWVDRLSWTDTDWVLRLEGDRVELWLLTAAGVPAGYFELDRNDDDIEIAYFGLVPRFIGQGLGAHLLTAAVQRAWAMGARRVWLHTCTLDHPAALDNYLARGFLIERVETSQRIIAAPAR
ncbi:MAG: GNAT family N-acetyltransferase [Longimicrobiales bacterium]